MINRYTPWLFQRVPGSRAAKIALDGALLGLCYPLAYVLRSSGGGSWDLLRDVPLTTSLLVPAKLAILATYGQYRVIWRYSSVRELQGLVKAATWGTVAAVVLTMGLRLEYSRAAMAIDWLLTLTLLGAVRFAARIRGERGAEPRRRGWTRGVQTTSAGERPLRVLIYGAGDAGEMMAREMTRPKRGNAYKPIGFIDDDPSKQGMSIHGLTVLGGRDRVASIVHERRVDEIVITIPSARGALVRQLVRACEGSGARLKIVPGLDEIVDGKVRIGDIRGLRLEDLLGRERVELNVAAISSYLRGRRVLVTGAGGSIGSELCRQIVSFHPAEILLFGRGENSIFRIHEELALANHSVALRQIIGDVINKKKLAGVFERFKPEIVFHAGADKHVPLMEMNPDEAVLNNILGTQNLLETADDHRAQRVVCISTDKAVNPTSVMGCCKRIAELLVQHGRYSHTTPVAVRFGNVLGSRGSVIPIFQRQIERGGPVTVTHPDIRRYFMTIREASQLVIQAGAMGNPGDLFILDMGEPVRIEDLARGMIHLAGYEPDLEIPIRFTGLRPGEKISEALILPGEVLEPTGHEKILRVRPDGGSGPPGLRRQISALAELAVAMDFPGVVSKLREIVPEFATSSLEQAGVSPEATKVSVEDRAGVPLVAAADAHSLGVV